MNDEDSAFASKTRRTILPREGIGADRLDVRPMAQAYDLSEIPSRNGQRVIAKQVAATPKSPVHQKRPKDQGAISKSPDHFAERLSRLR